MGIVVAHAPFNCVVSHAVVPSHNSPALIGVPGAFPCDLLAKGPPTLVAGVCDGGRLAGSCQQTLDLADARQRVLGAVPVISLDGCVERLLQTDLPFLQLEGVAPANFHLGAGGIGLCETIASMRNRALNKIDDLIEARYAQLGAK